MKATPIAQYLDQQGRGAPAEWPGVRRDVSPFKPRAAVGGSEDAVAPFRRSGLIAAVASRPPEIDEAPRPAVVEPAPATRESVFFRSRAAAAAPDIESRLSEAYHRGVQEGLDAAKAEAVTARALERAETQKRAVVERLDFQMNEYAKFGETISLGLVELERRIADVVARILQPFVTEAVSHQIIDELVENIARMRQSGKPPLLRATGPERLLSALKAKLEPMAVEVEYVEREGVELSVEADSTTIRSELGAWSELIASFVERT